MKILFLTLVDFDSLDDRNIYTDLLRKFYQEGHGVYVISPMERRKQKETEYLKIDDRCRILKLKIGNIQKTNIIEKGISTLLIEPVFISGIKKYLADIKFDLIMYSTPPITFYKSVEYLRRRDGARTYLLLKDIFPQNAVDIGMMKTTGIKSLLYKFFRNKEKKLYAISDHIGCMSQANMDYIIRKNPEIDPSNVEVCPNSIEVLDKSVDVNKRRNIRKKYDIPQDKIVFVYGGNLGKPQGIDFLIECLMSQKKNKEVYFLIVGDGTEYVKLDKFINGCIQKNIRLMRRLPKEEYDILVGACDVGMIFLDHRFTIPNFPSRLLSYMQMKIPVLACTDPNTDIGKIIVDGGFGWWMESNNVELFDKLICKISMESLNDYGKRGFKYLNDNYSVDVSYTKIIASAGDRI